MLQYNQKEKAHHHTTQARPERIITMKFHKIRNVDKSVCTAEQKIAYNFAFADRDWVKRSNMDLNDYIYKKTLDIYKYYPDIVEKYNIDAIIHCLRRGFIEYCKRPCGVLWSYEEIGKAFPSFYPIE